MTVYELNRDQLTELKQNYYTTIYNNVSYEELANIDNYVSDEEIYREYADYEFYDDDFSVGEDYRLEINASGSKDFIASDLRHIANQILSGYTSGLAPHGTSWSIE